MQTFNIQLENYNSELPLTIEWGMPISGPQPIEVDFVITENELTFSKDLSFLKTGYPIFIKVSQNGVEIYREMHNVE